MIRLPPLLGPLGSSSVAAGPVPAAKYLPLIREKIHADYQDMFRAEGGSFQYPFLTPGSAQYGDLLWDWDSWLSNVALRLILLEKATAEERAKTLKHEQGCVLNYLSYGGMVTSYIRQSSEVRWSGQFDVQRDFELSFPFFIKAGLAYNETIRDRYNTPKRWYCRGDDGVASATVPMAPGLLAELNLGSEFANYRLATSNNLGNANRDGYEMGVRQRLSDWAFVPGFLQGFEIWANHTRPYKMEGPFTGGTTGATITHLANVVDSSLNAGVSYRPLRGKLYVHLKTNFQAGRPTANVLATGPSNRLNPRLEDYPFRDGELTYRLKPKLLLTVTARNLMLNARRTPRWASSAPGSRTPASPGSSASNTTSDHRLRRAVCCKNVCRRPRVHGDGVRIPTLFSDNKNSETRRMSPLRHAILFSPRPLTSAR